jgi:hypothetical protein
MASYKTKQAIKFYAAEGYWQVNPFLRKQLKRKSVKAKETIEAFDNEFKRIIPIYKKEPLYRGCTSFLSEEFLDKTGITKEIISAGYKEGLIEKDFLEGKSPTGKSWSNYLTSKLSGKIFEDKGFVSTSESERPVFNFFLNANSDKILRENYPTPSIMKIISNKPFKFIDFESFTSDVKPESEILLNRGSKFKILKVNYKKVPPDRIYTRERNGQPYLEFEVELL